MSSGGSETSPGRTGNQRTRWIDYVFVILLEVALTAGLVMLDRYTPIPRFPVPYVLMMTAVAYVFGEGPAVLALLFGFMAFDYYFVPPESVVWPIADSAAGWAAVIEFLIITAVAGVGGIAMRRSRQRIQSLADDVAESSRQTSTILESIDDAFFSLDHDWRFVYVNQEAEKLLRKSRGQLLGMGIWDQFPEAVGTVFRTQYERAASELVTVAFEGYYPPFERWFDVRGYPSSTGLSVYFIDITERKLAEQERQALLDLLSLANQAVSLDAMMQTLMDHLRQRTGCEAIAVRLREGDDYPYLVASGFSEEFLRAESSLCAAGEPFGDSSGRPALECMCGNVLCSRFDQSRPYFTDRGSFWTSNASELVASLTDDDTYLAHIRGRCTREYESIALIPLRSAGDNLGMLQLNDKRKGVFDTRSVALLEELASIVGNVVARQRADKETAEARAEAERRAAELQSFFSSIVEGAALFDADGRIILANNAARTSVGAPRDMPLDVLARQYQMETLEGEALPPDQYPSSRALRGEMFTDSRHVIVTPWAQTPVSISGGPIRDAHGQVLGAAIVWHDIREQIEAERSLRRLYDHEHHIADVLQSILLSAIPSQIGSLRFESLYRAALEEARVGGDFYDVFAVDEDRVVIVIGDVAGKGLTAAAQIATAKYAIRSRVQEGGNPSDVLEHVNNTLVADADAGGFVTVFLGVMALSTKTLSYANAGHSPVIHWNAASQQPHLLEATGIPLGCDDGVSYREEAIVLAGGDELLLATDGLYEVPCQCDFLGVDSFVEVYAQSKRSGADTVQQLLDHVMAVCDGDMRDDVAILRVSVSK